MAEEQSVNQDVQVHKDFRYVVLSGALFLCVGSIIWLMLYGKPENALHVTQLSWSNTILAGILVALGVRSLPSITSFIRK